MAALTLHDTGSKTSRHPVWLCFRCAPSFPPPDVDLFVEIPVPGLILVTRRVAGHRECIERKARLPMCGRQEPAWLMRRALRVMIAALDQSKSARLPGSSNDYCCCLATARVRTVKIAREPFRAPSWRGGACVRCSGCSRFQGALRHSPVSSGLVGRMILAYIHRVCLRALAIGDPLGPPE